MDEDLLRIARRVFERAQKRRLDYLATTESAVREIQIVRPDVTTAEALSALNVVRRS
jgi:hypothetical protein